MRQKFLWLDLAVCSVWMLMCLGCRMWYSGNNTVLFVIVSRIVFAFALYRREIRSWVPLLLSVGLFYFSVGAEYDVQIESLSSTMFHMLGLPVDGIARMVVMLVLGIWICFVPVVMYLMLLFCRRLGRTELRWKDVLGAIMWNDHSARTYSLLMLVAFGALLSGLAMNSRICLFVCLTAPVLSYRLLMRHYGMSSGNLAVMVAGMLLFYYAQPTAGVWRICLLGMSMAVVAYMCIRLYLFKGRLSVFVLSVLYIGAMLPSLSIGYNQYACMDYGRYCYHTLEPYQGIFFVKDHTGELVGLRDRYGLLVRPEYDSVVYHDKRDVWGELELRRNGYYTLYSVCDNTFRQDDYIRHELQDSICRVVERHLAEFSYGYGEGLEVKVEYCVSGNLITHVRASKIGSTVYYEYGADSYIMTDSVAVESGEFAGDPMVVYKGIWYREGLSHSYDVLIDSVASYRILVQSARDHMSGSEELRCLALRVAKVLEEY